MCSNNFVDILNEIILNKGVVIDNSYPTNHPSRMRRIHAVGKFICKEGHEYAVVMEDKPLFYLYQIMLENGTDCYQVPHISDIRCGNGLVLGFVPSPEYLSTICYTGYGSIEKVALINYHEE
jgi:hypothetical protein